MSKTILLAAVIAIGGCNRADDRAAKYLRATNHPDPTCSINGTDRAVCVSHGDQFDCLVTNSAGCESATQVLCVPLGQPPKEKL